LLPLYYVEFFTTAADLNASAEFLKRADIENLAGAFDSTDYAISAPSTTQTPGGTSPSTRGPSNVDSDDLATFAALMQYIRLTPTPSDVKANNILVLATLDTALSDIYITGFITPYTGETPEQVKARLQSVPEEDRFTAVMVESYRLTSNPLLLDIIHQLLPLYYVEFFTTAADLNASAEFLKRADIENLADAFDSTAYAISAPSETQTPTSTATPSSTPTTTSDDRAVLAALYNATDGPNWSNRTNWLTSKPIGEWHGVTTDTNGRVTELDLSINGLSGVIPSDLGDLSNLQVLRLNNNDLTGAIPPELGDLTNLIELYLYNNDLSGEIPVELGNLTNLQSVYLSGNRLAGCIPSALSGVPNNDFIPSELDLPFCPATATPTPTSTVTPTIAQIVQNVQDGVVQILTITSSGSGFIIDTDGRVVTNQHVVSGNRNVTVRMNDGTEYPASVLGVDATADLAVVDIAPEIALTPVPLGDSSRVQVGEEVVAVGYPLGFQLGQSQTVSKGIISARRPNFQGSGVEHLQTDAAINPGNSGGPLFNRAGEVIGVNTSRRETTSDGRPVIGISFAVSINELKSRLETLKGSGSQQPVTTPTPVPTPATPVPTPAAAPTPPPLPLGWNRYENGVYGFSVDMPPGWSVNEDTHEDNYVFFHAVDRAADVSVKAYDLPASYSLQRLAEWRRDWLTEYARDESWNVFEIISFGRKQEGGKEFYELVLREQSSTEFCVERTTERIYISSWYPSKPHGYRVNSGICEHSLNLYSANNRAIQNSFTEWMPYWNAAHAFGLNVAPGWTLEQETEADDYAAFWAP
ncbi:MAG: trypsin-like peptidase domain-containing protein, partial [Dehalococcoidia bacterium]|nr:trypsin-like peptidase domain-containing protein [Dehalococcoidia bacterium]